MPRRQFTRLEEEQSRLRRTPRCVSLSHAMAGRSSSLDRIDRLCQLLSCRLQRLGVISSSLRGELRLVPLKSCPFSCSLFTLGRLPEQPPKLCDRINRLLLRAATSRWHARSLVDRDIIGTARVPALPLSPSAASPRGAPSWADETASALDRSNAHRGFTSVRSTRTGRLRMRHPTRRQALDQRIVAA